MADEIKPVAWTSKYQLKRAKEDPGCNLIMWGEPLPWHEDVALCRYDEAMAEIERLKNRVRELLGTGENLILDNLASMEQANKTRLALIGLAPSQSAIDTIDQVFGLFYSHDGLS